MTELLGKDLESGMSYMVWAVPSSETGDACQADDVIATVIRIDGTVELKVSDVTFEGATVSAVRKGCASYYTGIADKDYYSAETVVKDLAYGGGNLQSADYNGPLTGGVLDFFTKATPGASYVVWAIPYKEEKNYEASEVVAVEIVVPPLTYGGTAAVSIGNVSSTVTTARAALTPGADCYLFYYAYITKLTLDNYASDEDVISYLIKSGKSSKVATDFERGSLEPGTKGMIVAVAVSSQGQVGALVKVQADVKELSYNSSIAVAVSAEAGAQSVTFTLTPTGGPVKYRYVHMKLNDFKSYPYWGDEEAVKHYLSMNEGVTEVTAASLADNKLVIGDLLFKTEYVLYMVAVDADGNPSSTMAKESYTSAKPVYVRKESGADLWNAGAPKVTVDKIEKNGNFYSISYTVKAGANNKEFYVYAASDSYLSGKMFDEQIKIVMTKGVKCTADYSGGAAYASLPTNINVTWVDTEGRFYEVSKTVIGIPAE